jgi:hypothetical protein
MVTKEDGGGYSGQCLELPAAISKGETLDELREDMKDAIQLVLEPQQHFIAGASDSRITTSFLLPFTLVKRS